MTAPEGYRWVSCSQSLSWDIARSRHLIAKGSDTTACNATGLGNVWHTNATKPECKNCLARYEWVLKNTAPIL